MKYKHLQTPSLVARTFRDRDIICTSTPTKTIWFRSSLNINWSQDTKSSDILGDEGYFF